MSTTPAATALLVWLTPSMFALFLYGIGQGLVKQYIGEVSPARFCLYFVLAKAMVNLSWFFTHDHPPLLSADGRAFLELGVLAYVIDGTGWILYFESIIAGPITIVGTLSAAYPALTVLFARIFLGERLGVVQYSAVALVIGGCLGLSYSPPDAAAKILSQRWIPLAFLALTSWATSNTSSNTLIRMPRRARSTSWYATPSAGCCLWDCTDCSRAGRERTRYASICTHSSRWG
jgi:uncharacterized membrane protein